MWFMLAAGARPKETKINLMDCICLCSEVEMLNLIGQILLTRTRAWYPSLKHSRKARSNIFRGGTGAPTILPKGRRTPADFWS